VTPPVSKIVTVLLLSAMFAAGAGGACILPASAAHSPSAGCHSGPVPSNPQPADYRCCAQRQSSALRTNVFSPRRALPRFEADAIRVLVTPPTVDVVPAAFAVSAGPPGVLILRI
jgi:hypothetical protein